MDNSLLGCMDKPHLILYIDMDNVLVDFTSAFPHLSEGDHELYKGRLDEVPGIFSKMQPNAWRRCGVQ